MAARRRSNSDGGFAVVFVLLLVVAVIVEFFWWILGAAALVGLCFAGRALLRESARRRELAQERDVTLRLRADRQHRWLLTGDSRGLYGPEGASAMRAVSPPPPPIDSQHVDAQAIPTVATLATTADQLAVVMAEKPPAWQWAVFTSVLVQRMTPLLPRLRDSELGFRPSSPSSRVSSGPQLALILLGLLDELLSTLRQVESFTLAPAFMGSFGDQTDESTVDPAAIAHTANRLMDYHDRLLELSERCRGLSVPSEHSVLLADCARLLDIPLQSYRAFIAEFVDVIEGLPAVLKHSSDVIDLGTIALDFDIDDRLFSRIFKRLDAISN